MLSIHRTILLSEDAITAVDKLILLKRSEKPSFSKSFISKKLGIQSRGYLTDVLKGRKRINATYIKPLVSMLGLDECESRYLVSKWLLTSNFARSKISREELQRECENQAKNLRREEIEFSGKTDVDALFLVYLTLYLYPNGRCRRRYLHAKISWLGAERIERALSLLIKHGLILFVDGSYEVDPNRGFSFLDGNLQESDEHRFLQSSIQESLRHLKKMKSHRDEVIFHSTLLTVKKQDLAITLKKFRSQLLTMRSEVESDDADSLIRFNIQLYPLLDFEEKDMS